MSAFIVSDTHIRYLVSAMLRYGVIKISAAGSTAAELIRANVESVNRRYPGDKQSPYRLAALDAQVSTVMEEVRELRLTTREAIASLHAGPGLTVAAIAKAVDCYGYQIAEFDGWENSAAWRLCCELRGVLLRVGEPRWPDHDAGYLLPRPEYDAAAWSL